MNKQVNFTLYGRIPSKKNSTWTKIINGRLIRLPSKKYQDWNKEQSQYLNSVGLKKCADISEIHLKFFAPDKRKADLSNKTESVMDLLVDNNIIQDDNWFVVPKLILTLGGIDREEPRVEVSIIEESK